MKWAGLGAAWWLSLVLAVTASAATPAGWSLSAQYWATRKPNLILIVADSVARDELGSYGATRAVTPHLDQLAAGGMRFTQAYAGSPDNGLARASLLTGRHAGQWAHRVAGEFSLQSTDITVARVLQSAGYATGALGVWGLGPPDSPGIPPRQGFDEWLGYLSLQHAEDAYPTQLWRNADALMLEKNFYGYRGLPASDLITQAATNFVRINKFKPFFLYLAYPSWSVGATATEPHRPAALGRLDAEVGKVLTELGRLNLSNHTAIFFTSTPVRRPAGGEPAVPTTRAGIAAPPPSDLSDAHLRVPLLAWWPGKIPAGTVSHQVGAFWDFLPTAAEIASAKTPPESAHGISLLATLQGRPQTNQPTLLYWESHRHGLAQAVRLGDWKGIRHEPAAALRLYDLKSDPGETNNVARHNPKIVARLEAALRQARLAF